MNGTLRARHIKPCEDMHWTLLMSPVIMAAVTTTASNRQEKVVGKLKRRPDGGILPSSLFSVGANNSVTFLGGL